MKNPATFRKYLKAGIVDVSVNKGGVTMKAGPKKRGRALKSAKNVSKLFENAT